MSVELPLYSNHVREGSTLVDDDIAAWIGDGKLSLWYGYVLLNSVQLHRQIMGCVRGDGTEVHHVNEDPTDNRRENLLVVNGKKEHGAQPHPWRGRLCSLLTLVEQREAHRILARERVAAGILRPIGGYRVDPDSIEQPERDEVAA